MLHRYIAIACIAVASTGCRPRVSTVQSTESAAPPTHRQDRCDPTLPLSSRSLGISEWEDLATECRDRLASYLEANDDGYEKFATSALGRHGLPLVLLMVLPDLDPDTWGAPETKFARFGLFMDERRPERTLPSGLAFSAARAPAGDGQPNPDLVTLSCGGCHIGRVRLREDTVQYVDGGTNSSFDVNQWRSAFGKTLAKAVPATANPAQQAAALSTFADRIVQAVAAKPQGYFYGPMATEAHETEQRTLFGDKSFVMAMLKGFMDRIPLEKLLFEKRIATSYGQDDGWKILFGGAPGQVDAIGNSIYRVVGQQAFGPHPTPAEIQAGREEFMTKTFDALPTFPTPADFMSIWGQQHRATAQWNGDLVHPFWRNLAAQLGVVGDPASVDMSITAPIAAMMYKLPAAVYPFDASLEMAKRGEELFAANCADCHHASNAKVYSVQKTDMNKARMINSAAAQYVIASLREACKDHSFTVAGVRGESERPCALQDNQIIIGRFTPDTQGYAAPFLDGIWQRAPYLHNGSVPTLRHLLAPSTRPDVFVRGSVTYDAKNLGWAWRIEDLASLKAQDPVAAAFDTTLAGFAHTGHDRDITVGEKTYVLDWGQRGREQGLEDLLEYMKTL